jgi:hypothetical protein
LAISFFALPLSETLEQKNDLSTPTGNRKIIFKGIEQSYCYEECKKDEWD